MAGCACLLLIAQPVGGATALAQTEECASLVTDADEPIVASPGETFAIGLEARPGTGYSWTISAEPDEAIAIAQGDQVVPAQTSIPGGLQEQCFTFQAVGLGHTTVVFAYARPFDAQAEPAQTTEFIVIVAEPQAPMQIPFGK
jgi:inhibitor of cysteine peptidase